MPSFSTIAISTVALLAGVQYCPAPPLVAVIGIDTITAIGTAATVAGTVSSTVEGAVSDAKGKRGLDGFQSRVRRGDYGLGTAPQDCKNQLTSAHVTFSRPSGNNVLVQGIPPACMTLSTVITGKFDEGNPVPMGSDSIQFSNLSDDDITTIQNALNAHPK